MIIAQKKSDFAFLSIFRGQKICIQLMNGVKQRKLHVQLGMLMQVQFVRLYLGWFNPDLTDGRD